MKLEVNIEKRYAYGILGLLVVIAGIVAVNAFGGTSPTTVGHSIGEIEGDFVEVGSILNNRVCIGNNENGIDCDHHIVGPMVYAYNRACANAWRFTTNSQCASAACSVGPFTRYYSCGSTNCEMSSPTSSQTCNNYPQGYLFSKNV